MPQQAARLDSVVFRAQRTAIATEALQIASICGMQEHSCKAVQPDTNGWIMYGVYKFCASRGVDAGSRHVKTHFSIDTGPEAHVNSTLCTTFEPFRGLQNEQRHEVHRMRN